MLLPIVLVKALLIRSLACSETPTPTTPTAATPPAVISNVNITTTTTSTSATITDTLGDNHNKNVTKEPAPVEEVVDEGEGFRTSHAITINGVPFPREGKAFQPMKPEFDSKLSALIGENVRSIIDSHTAKESFVATTTSKSLIVDINDINLLEAGSENKHKSRIVTKTGDNGKEYEYEYYYYYEDEGDEVAEDVPDIKESKTKPETAKVVQERVEPTEGPLYTRFPPRDSASSTTKVSEDRKHHVKRPSLELVDSHSFTTDKKAPQRGNVEVEKVELKEVDNDEASTVRPATPSAETTAFIMHKSAIDLYAMLANEMSENDIEALSTTTTEAYEEPTTTPTTTTAAPTTTTTPEPEKRGVLPIGRRNRPGLRKTASSSVPTQSTTPPASESTYKTRGRYNKSPSRASSNTEPEEKPVETSTKSFGRTRNRFNLKPAITRAPAPESRPSSDEETVSSSTARAPLSSRARPNFGNRRSSSSRTPSSTTETTAAVAASSQDVVEEPRPTQARRTNGLITRKNPLLSRKRDEAKQAQAVEEEKTAASEAAIAPTESSGVNRLKSRPRLNVAPSPRAASPNLALNRRVNPLLKSRLTSSTTETPAEEEPSEEQVNEETVTEEVHEEINTEPPTPKPHGLAALRRKIVLRQPGKIN